MSSLDKISLNLLKIGLSKSQGLLSYIRVFLMGELLFHLYKDLAALAKGEWCLSGAHILLLLDSRIQCHHSVSVFVLPISSVASALAPLAVKLLIALSSWIRQRASLVFAAHIKSGSVKLITNSRTLTHAKKIWNQWPHSYHDAYLPHTRPRPLTPRRRSNVITSVARKRSC